MINITKIYLITNCFNDPNKVYIGKTIGSRKWAHENKFGKCITYDYIDEVNSLDKSIWEPIESFWISYFRFLGFDVQNKNNGGGGMTIGTKSFIEGKYKSVLQYDLEGNFIREWPSLDSISKYFKTSTASISLCCSNKSKTSLGFIWRLKSNPINNKFKLPLHKGSKKILQYDPYGNFIKEWDCYGDIMKEFNCSSSIISICCSGKQKYLGEYIIRLKNNKNKIKFPKIENRFKVILQYDLDENLLKEWKNIKEIKENTEFNTIQIIGCCNKHSKTSQNYIWKFKP